MAREVPVGSTKSRKSGATTSAMEDVAMEDVEPGPGLGPVPAVPKEKRAQPQTSTTHRSTGLHSPSVRLGSHLGSHNDPTTLANVAPPSRPTLAQLG